MSKEKTNNKNTGTKKDFAPSIGFWPAKSGKGFSVYVSEDLKNTLAKAEVGSTLSLTEVNPSVREESPKAPHYRITIFAPTEKTNDNEL